MFTLSHVLLAREISLQTPRCVLESICHSHAVRFDPCRLAEDGYRGKLIEYIKKKEFPPVFPSGGLTADMAHFVNPDVRWPVSNLQEALTILLDYLPPKSPSTNLPEVIVPGYPTPEDITRVPLSVLCGVCVRAGLPLTFQTTVEELVEWVQLLRSSDLVSILLSRVRRPSDLIPLIGKLPSEPPDLPLIDPTYDSRSLESQLNTEVDLIETPLAAVIRAAQQWDLDLSRSPYPVQDYYHYRAYRKVLHPVLAYRMKRNPGLLFISHYFNPVFPRNYYLRSQGPLSEQEGLDEAEDVPSYQFLWERYHSRTFYSGWLPEIERQDSIIDLIPEGECASDDMLCFGTREGEMRFLTFPELHRTLVSQQSLANPFLFRGEKIPEPLDDYQKQKLLWCCQDYCRKKKCSGLDILVKTLLEKENNARSSFGKLWEAYPEKHTEIVRSLQSLFQVGVRMRGWEDGEVYPIQEVPDKPEQETEERAYQALEEFEAVTCDLGEAKTWFLGLFLLGYKNGQWILSRRLVDGATIGERLNIVRRNDRQESCIRLTSNWLLVTVYFYLTSCGEEAPFDIGQLRYIN